MGKQDSVAVAPPRDRRTINGADLVVEALLEVGAEKVFSIIGLGMLGLGRAFYDRRDEIGYVGHLNETNLTMMAQGYARQTGKPTFCFVYHASGTALSMMSMTTAWADNVPMVFVSTSSARSTIGRDQYAGIPRSPIEMSSQFTKWSHDISAAERIPEILARAWEIASTVPMGPVHISIPSDLYDVEVATHLARKSLKDTQRFVETAPDNAGTAEVARLLANAEYPVLLCGSEVGNLKVWKEMVALAEATGAPVICEQDPSYLGFPTSHAQYIGTPASNADVLAEADLAIAVGYEFTEKGIPGEAPILPASVKLVTVSSDPLLHGKQLRPDVALQGHLAKSLPLLAQEIQKVPATQKTMKARAAVCHAKREARAAAIAEADAMSRDLSPIPQKRVLRELCDKAEKDWIVVQAGSTLGWHLESMYEFDDPTNFHAVSGKASAQGWGAPAALGIQLGEPDRRVLAVLGDGNFMFSATCIWSAAQQDLPAIFVVNNNSGWVCVPDAIDAAYDRETDGPGRDAMAWTWGEAEIDYVGFARSFGLEARRVATSSELGDALEEAKQSNRAWLIEVCGV
ncbi:hypothetical protein GQE99_11845 [Maritimibacter sp. DP07]|uniref:Thiamine pyrophosphate-binding protein n=1 Tax=Maritimibacter harenae TaxID=2606218 RepID=A0A845M5K3_9RHOB|nr:thiamine pyrophosphate-binding protein [Maritimibacter harenae]MZR13708.1 hypothetical protein [Maritimibacter harenae]